MDFPISDRAWGVERHALSDDFGKIVAPTINIWSTKNLTKLKGTIEHGDLVEVLESEKLYTDGREVFRIECKAKNMTGWILGSFLEKIGAKQ